MNTDVNATRAYHLGSLALTQATAGRHHDAGDTVQRLGDECGAEGIELALRGWIDTYADHAADGGNTPGVGAMKLINPKTGAMVDADSPELEDHVRWAAQLITARIELNEFRWDELLDIAPEDDGGRHILAVLWIAANTMRNLPRGFLNLGRA